MTALLYDVGQRSLLWQLQQAEHSQQHNPTATTTTDSGTPTLPPTPPLRSGTSGGTA